MNILLLYPEMPSTMGKLDELVKFAGRKSSFPPIGLLTVAALLPADWHKKLIDLNVSPLKEKHLKRADYVFISAMNVQRESARAVIKFCNKFNISVVAGGPLFTHEYENFEGVDHFVLNEAEITLPVFLDDLRKGKPGHIYKTDKFAEITETPAPVWELVDLNKYLYSVIQYSRGCPYFCDFCDVTVLFGRVPRTKSIDQILNELDILIKSGNNEMIFFADDNLIGNKRKLKKELLPALIKWRSQNPFAPSFATQLTINLTDDAELMTLLLEAGFRHILIGIETINEAGLIQMKKKQNSGRNILNDVKLLQSKGFLVFGTFILGLDTDKETVFDDLVNFIEESGLIFVIINLLKAPPGTELFERMKKENRLIRNFEFNEERTNITTVMNPEKLYSGYLYVLEKIYSPENLTKRIFEFYNNLKSPAVKYPIKRKLSAYDIFIILIIFYRLYITGADRKHYRKLLFFTLRKNTRYLDLTLLFSAMMKLYGKILLSVRNG